MEDKKENKKPKPEDREKLADKVLEIFSDSPEDMESLIQTLKALENNPVLHPEKQAGIKDKPAGENGKNQA